MRREKQTWLREGTAAPSARDTIQHGGRLSIETANAEVDKAYLRAHFQVAPTVSVRFT
jgi:hypothetical protein